MLNIAYKDFRDLMIGDEDPSRFEIIYDDIPKDGHSNKYIEKDGRQYRIFHFKNLETGRSYLFNYTMYPDYPFEMSHIITDLDEIGLNII